VKLAGLPCEAGWFMSSNIPRHR